MEPTLLDQIPLCLDLVQLLKQFRIREDSEIAQDIRRMAEEASSLGRPKALYRACLVEARGEDFVVVAGRKFTSRVLVVNLERVYRVFPFVATCGVELEEWSKKFESGLMKYCSEGIKGTALVAAIAAVLDHIRVHHRPGKVSMMNPGSLEDWPITEQRLLFQILDNTVETVGVELMDSLLMRPGMSASGLWFPSEENYENCMLCPMENCPGRRAPYEEGLYERKYRRE